MDRRSFALHKRDLGEWPMIGIVKVALNRPLTFIVMAIVIAIAGILAAMRTPVDIFPDPHSGDRCGLAICRSVARRNELAHHEYARAGDDDHRQQYRTYGKPVLQGIGIIKAFFQPGTRYPHRDGADHIHFADGAAIDAAGRQSAADPEL